MARQIRNNEYFRRKLQAYHRYGQADDRPQQNFKHYLLEKRKLNFGYSTRENTQVEAIEMFNLTRDDLIPAPLDFRDGPLPIGEIEVVWIETEDMFSRMIRHLQNQREIALDLEMNHDHSYLGMTCIIQLGTYDRIYLVDPFPVFDSIKQDLKEVLENPKILKIMSGMDNDVLAFQRDFEIYLNGAIDAAQLQTELFRNSFEMLKEARTTDFKNVDRNEILYRCCHKNGSLLSQQEIDTKCTKKSSLKDMAKWYFPKYPEPEDATLADWRLRPIMGRMQEYAVFDVYVLLHIWSWMKRLVKLQANTNEMLQRTVETDKKLLLKTYRTPTRLTLQEQLRKGNVPPVDRVRLNLVYNYVQLRAKIVDESPNELVTVADMAVLIQRAETQRITPEEIVQLVAARRRIPSETIEDTSQSLARVLNEGETFIESTHRAVCHACNGTFDYPHVAWMCCKIGTYQDQKEFLNRPEQKEAKHRRYQRNKEKYMAKYPDKPFPPLSQ